MSLQTTLDGNTSYPSITRYPGVTVPADGNWHQISVTGYTMANSYDPGSGVPLLPDRSVVGQRSRVVLHRRLPAHLRSPRRPFRPTFRRSTRPSPISSPSARQIDTTDLSGPHAQLLTMHFNSITSGNDMKWSSVEATKGTYNYTNCRRRSRRGRLQQHAGPRTQPGLGDRRADSRLRHRRRNQLRRQPGRRHRQYPGAHPERGAALRHARSTRGTSSTSRSIPRSPTASHHGPFYQVLGKSYIDIALQAARQYAPAGTKLFINDYSTTDPNRLACLVQVVRDLRSRGIPARRRRA